MPAAMKSLFASGASTCFWKPRRAAHMETATAGPALGGGWRLTPTRKFNGRTHGAFLRYAVAPVPELTRSDSIQLNDRVSLQRSANAISQSAPDIVAPLSGPCVAKSPGDHVPLGGFV
jgi:hypothetical protein